VQATPGLPLTPIQQGMLYHHLRDRHSGVDVEQMVADLPEALDPEALRRAWEWLLNRHVAFRSGFAWEGQAQPVQVPQAHVSLPWEQFDLRDHPPEAQQAWIAAFLDRDRQAGFDFLVAPLSRATLLRTGESQWTFVWTFHHILADGNTYPAIIREGFSAYEALREGREPLLPPPASFSDAVCWFETRVQENQGRAQRFWRERLEGFSAATPLPGLEAECAGRSGRAETSLRLSPSTTTALQDLARAHGLTLSTLVQAAWALVLGTHSGAEEVLFGLTRSCRGSAPADLKDAVGLLINTVPIRVPLSPAARVIDWLRDLRTSQTGLREFETASLIDIQRSSDLAPGAPLFESLVVFTPRLVGAVLRELGGPWERRDIRFLERTIYPLALFAYAETELVLKLAYDRARIPDATAERCLGQMRTMLEALPACLERTLGELPLLSGTELQAMQATWNATARPYPQDKCVHELFEAQVQRTPQAIAAVFRNHCVTYAELNCRANRIARLLRSRGVAPRHLVGIFLHRSLELVAALLGTLKAGAAYVPLDPSYPADRLRVMLEDAQLSAVLTSEDLANELPVRDANVVLLDKQEESPGGPESAADVVSGVGPKDLAYVIFTSGSSGRPKGVQVVHGNVVNLFTGIDDLLQFKEPGTWLAVTSTAFDISVLELFWTLSRGFKVVIQEEARRPDAEAKAARTARREPMQFSLFYFAADAGETGKNRYRLLLEGAKFADEHGFAAVWTPERHFHPFGGLYPNPSLTSAAIAVITSRVQIRAGSVVLPLHDPIRVAEEWSVVDNLSQGRVGLSFASGWHANDFALMPHNYKERREVMARSIDVVRRLWRGEMVRTCNGPGEEIEIRIYPPPIQRDPPLWLTTAGNIETFRSAGRMGANVLTNLLGQKPEELAEKLTAYRTARQESGHAGRGHVTLMLHTFVGTDLEQVRALVRKPFLEYLRVSTDLIQQARWDCPAFANKADCRSGPGDASDLSEADLEVLMDHAFDRYFTTSGLFGTPQTCLEMVDHLKAIGVDEVACLIDFGVEGDAVLEGLRHLDELRQRSQPEDDEGDHSIPVQIKRHQVTHLQCTPSLARMLAAETEGLEALRSLRKLLVGGEALPPALAGQLAPTLAGDLINVYGPTETTVWSTADLIDRSGGPITIGRPLANTQLYVLDRQGRPVPVGVPGELFIGGAGVARGYLGLPDLTAERFIPDPFSPVPGARLYATGDLVRYRDDGRLEYLGRLDHQVKIRGYRIELGEIEAVLARHPAVREAVVVARDNGGGDRTLVGYVGATPPARTDEAVVAGWRAVWDTAYASSNGNGHAPADPTLNTAGWISSRTGQLLPEAEMREWVGHTVERILAVRPRRVLEIGCGTGMLLFRIAPHCEQYHGLDVSASVMESVQAEAARQGLRNVTLRRAAADDLTGLEPGSFDCIVLNSVIQYFPNADYLVSVLERLLPLVQDGGTIFLGDVRNLALLDSFHTWVELEQAPDSLSSGELRQRIRQRGERETELVFDPGLFRALPRQLPRLRKVETHLKRGRAHNELTCFRYDVLLGIGGSQAAAAPPAFEPGTGLDLAGIRQRLATAEPVVAWSGLLNPRVAGAVRARELLASDDCPETAGRIRERLAHLPSRVEPEDLFTLAVPYEVQATWSASAQDRFDVVFRQRSAPPAPPAAGSMVSFSSAPWESWTNRRAAAALDADLPRELKELAKTRLPEYMVPATIVVLDALPRTPNGKIDRKALPQPGLQLPATSAAYCAPRTELEKDIAGVWQELLELERVGAQDNFFDLGANSLLMVQASSRLRAVLRSDLSLIDLFRYPTVGALAAHLSRSTDDGAALEKSQERGLARGEALQRRRLAARSAPATPRVPPGPGPV
jgi:natural product biosynthesis luciferase-like monooxygenase protein